MDASSLNIEIKPSKLKLYYFVLAHGLAMVSVLLLNQFAMDVVIVKLIFIFLLLLSFKHYFVDIKKYVRLYFKPDDSVDLTIGDRCYDELQLSRESYVSDIYVQLEFLDADADRVHKISIFPDSLTAQAHSFLRARLKLISNTAGISDS